MIILGIETSCDDTSISLIKVLPEKKGRFKVLSNIVSSQIKVHRKYGGVYPALAKREHQKNLVLVLQKALKKAKLLKNRKKKETYRIKTLEKILEREPELLKNLSVFFKKYQQPKIDLIAVTQGPGLEPCLWVGINLAKALSCNDFISF